MITILKFIGIWLMAIPCVVFYPLLACFGYSMTLSFNKRKGEE